MDFQADQYGDIYIANGDVPPTRLSEYIGQRVWFILRSQHGDWAQYPDRGANIKQYFGYQNRPSTKTIVETEILEELERDTILRAFPIEVLYTPVSLNESVVEVQVTLPDGDMVSLKETIIHNGQFTSHPTIRFTPADYDQETVAARSEIVTLENASNILEVTHRIADDLVIISPYSGTMDISPTGNIVVDEYTSGVTYHIDFDLQMPEEVQEIYSGVSSMVVIVDDTIKTPEQYEVIEYNSTISGISISGISTEYVKVDFTYDIGEGSQVYTYQLPSDSERSGGSVYDTRTYTYQFPSGIVDIMETKLVSNVNVTVDDSEIFTSDFTYSDNLITLYSAPTEYFTVDVIYYDSCAVASIDEIYGDTTPHNIFPRIRTSYQYYVVTKQSLEPGQYFVQYTSNDLVKV